MANKKEQNNEIETPKKVRDNKKTNTNKTKSNKNGTTKKINTNTTTKKNSEKKPEVKKTNENKKIKSTSKKPVDKIVKNDTNIATEKVLKEKNISKIKEETIPSENEEIKITTNESKEKLIVKDDKQIIDIFEKVIILVAVALVFSLIGYFIGNKNNTKNLDNIIAEKELHLFIEQYNEILENYYTDIDKDKLIRGAISGMLSTLDGYSQVIDDSSNNFTVTLEGSYEGLGIEIVNDTSGNIVIYGVYEDTPAAKAGIQMNDILKKVNGIDLTNVSTNEFVKMVADDSEFEITILRNNKELNVKLKKEKIEIKSVKSEMLENNIGYISVSIFANNTYKQFKEALNSLEKQDMKSLIIDLRDNTGGHLNIVKQMLGLFLDSSHVIYKTETKGEVVEFYSNGTKDKKYNIVILQNGISASASEIMSSALKEQLNAYIIGTTSYGKGTVQQLMTIEGIGQYKFTTKKWLTSKGEWIEGVGVTPNLEVNLDDNYYKNPTRENDLQFKKAVEYLNEK